MQTVLVSKRVEAGRKNFVLELVQNDRGKCIRIIEQGMKRDIVIVPEEAFAEVGKAFGELAAVKS